MNQSEMNTNDATTAVAVAATMAAGEAAAPAAAFVLISDWFILVSD